MESVERMDFPTLHSSYGGGMVAVAKYPPKLDNLSILNLNS